MAGVVQHPCLVPGCPELLVGLRGLRLGVCGTHRDARTVEIDGVNLRYCAGCYTFHPTGAFSSNSHICRVSEIQHATAQRRQHRLMNGRGTMAAVFIRIWEVFRLLPRAVKPRASALLDALSLHIFPATASHDRGKEVFGRAVMAFLRGETIAAKVTLPFLYASTRCLPGPHEVETWASITLAASFLHLLLPCAHHRLYVQPLREVRLVAEETGLAVSSSFQFLDPSDHLKYEEFVRGSLGSGCTGSVRRMVGVSISMLLPAAQAFQAVNKVWGVSIGWTLLCFLALVGAMYFPARLRALAPQHLRGAQHLDAALLVLSSSLTLLPMICAWVTGAHSCGPPQSFLSLSNEMEIAKMTLWLVVAYSLLLALLLEGPISLVAPVTAAITMLRISVCLMVPWCLKLETGVALSFFTQVLLSTAWLAGGIACMALEIRREKSQMLCHIHQMQSKQAEPLDTEPFYEGDPHLLLAVKMGDVSPAHLPINLRERILSTMQVFPESFTGLIRPGCVLLGLEMRFRCLSDMRAAWTSLLSHCNWNNTLLDNTTAAIDMSIQGSLYTVRDGRLQHRLPTIQGTSIIKSVQPLAPSPAHTTLSLLLSRLGEQTFKVLLRCGGHYHELEVAGTSAEDPSTGQLTAVVRLPVAALDGMGWVEVMVDTQDGSLVMSEASPVLFTSVTEAAEELSRTLPAHCPGDSQFILGGLLADLAICLQGQSVVPPLLLSYVAELGLTACFKHLATSAAALLGADRQGQGLLGSAVRSGSTDMLRLVMSMMEEFHLPVNPCRQALDARGYTALHWSAAAGDVGAAYMLLAEVPNPLESWKRCAARACGKTPAELMAELGTAFALNEDILKKMENDFGNSDAWDLGHDGHDAASAVWGADVAAAFGRHPVVTHGAVLALYTSMCLQLGWRNSLAWWSVTLTCVTVHIVLPYVYKQVYLKGLAEVRLLAAEQGLSVSWALRFLGAADMQGMYEHFVAQQASTKLLHSSACTTSVLLLASAAPLSRAAEHGEMWRHAAVLLWCGAMVSLQAWAILTKRLRLWRWLEPAVTLFFYTMAVMPEVAWITRNSQLRGRPWSILLNASPIHQPCSAVPCLFGLQLVTMTISMIVLMSAVPKAPGVPVHLLSEIPIVIHGLTVTAFAHQWCAANIPGMDSYGHGNLHTATGMIFSIMWRLIMIGVRLRAEKENLCAFLSSNALQRAKDSEFSQ